MTEAMRQPQMILRVRYDCRSLLFPVSQDPAGPSMPLRLADLQGILEEHSRSSAHHTGLSEKVLLLLPMNVRGEVEGE